MDRIRYDDAIFALATPPGTSAVAVIRCSGPGLAGTVAPLICRRDGAAVALRPRRVTTGFLRDPEAGRLVDEVIVLFMEGPRSFTREDVVEIQCHGSMVVCRRIMALLRGRGLRHAEPGEFTRRAFLNGRIGLSEAEGINDLVHARTDSSAELALDQMHGALRNQVTDLRRRLIDLIALIEANIDFPEEDIEILDRESLRREIHDVRTRIRTLLASYERGRILCDGLRTSIAGRPNVGKSSLLNILLKTERALVSETPGTTRDTIEEAFSHGGVLYRIVDTAGLRATDEPVEAMGIARSRQEMERADLVLYVVDRSLPPDPADREQLGELPRDRTVVVLNKRDRPCRLPPDFEATLDRPAVPVSALTGEGIDDLLELLTGLARDRLIPAATETILTSARHRDALTEALEALDAFAAGWERGVPIDVALIDLYETSRALGLVIGEVVTEDILDRIFETFCIGK